MYSPYEVETLAKLQREEVARQVAAFQLAQKATRDRSTPRAWRRQLAAVLRTTARWLAPTATESGTEAEPVGT
jgi:hypothetical protein